MVRLTRPCDALEDSFRKALEEVPDGIENGFHWPGEEDLRQGFAHYTDGLLRMEDPATLDPGLVLQTTLWLVDEGEFIGLTRLRHTLNASLLRHGGHIGYGIRPSRRGRGYGKLILKLTLDEAKKLGLERVLVTCDARNSASRRVIEGNGGALENEVEDVADGEVRKTARYWIDLAKR